jgi:hypothetical protein
VTLAPVSGVRERTEQHGRPPQLHRIVRTVVVPPEFEFGMMCLVDAVAVHANAHDASNGPYEPSRVKKLLLGGSFAAVAMGMRNWTIGDADIFTNPEHVPVYVQGLDAMNAQHRQLVRIGGYSRSDANTPPSSPEPKHFAFDPQTYGPFNRFATNVNGKQVDWEFFAYGGDDPENPAFRHDQLYANGEDVRLIGTTMDFGSRMVRVVGLQDLMDMAKSACELGPEKNKNKVEKRWHSLEEVRQRREPSMATLSAGLELAPGLDSSGLGSR